MNQLGLNDKLLLTQLAVSLRGTTPGAFAQFSGCSFNEALSLYVKLVAFYYDSFPDQSVSVAWAKCSKPSVLDHPL